MRRYKIPEADLPDPLILPEGEELEFNEQNRYVYGPQPEVTNVIEDLADVLTIQGLNRDTDNSLAHEIHAYDWCYNIVVTLEDFKRVINAPPEVFTCYKSMFNRAAVCDSTDLILLMMIAKDLESCNRVENFLNGTTNPNFYNMFEYYCRDSGKIMRRHWRYDTQPDTPPYVIPTMEQVMELFIREAINNIRSFAEITSPKEIPLDNLGFEKTCEWYDSNTRTTQKHELKFQAEFVTSYKDIVLQDFKSQSRELFKRGIKDLKSRKNPAPEQGMYILRYYISNDSSYRPGETVLFLITDIFLDMLNKIIYIPEIYNEVSRNIGARIGSQRKVLKNLQELLEV